MKFGEILDYASLDDETLLRLIAHAKPEALSALYDRYARLVFSLAWYTVGDRETAEEITQDVFFRVWEKASTYREEQARVSTWLTSITRYRSIDLLRQRGVRPEKDSVGWDDLAPGTEPVAENTPEDHTEMALQRERVRMALAALPPEQKRSLFLAYFHGMSHSQISEQLGEPLGTVKTRIRLAMQKLREILREDFLMPK